MRPPIEYLVPEFDTEIPVFPFGLFDDGREANLFFRDFNEVCTENYSAEQLKDICDYFWKKKAQKDNCSSLYFDFTNPDHVAQLYLDYLDVACDRVEKEQEPYLLRTLHFYEDNTYLEDYQKEILYLKVKKYKNVEIAEIVNNKYGKSYTANYISTIFRQKLISKICATAAYHIHLMENVYYRENFKKCSCCGHWRLVDSNNFVRKANAPDGFSAKCKLCDKKER